MHKSNWIISPSTGENKWIFKTTNWVFSWNQPDSPMQTTFDTQNLKNPICHHLSPTNFKKAPVRWLAVHIVLHLDAWWQLPNVRLHHEHGQGLKNGEASKKWGDFHPKGDLYHLYDGILRDFLLLLQQIKTAKRSVAIQESETFLRLGSPGFLIFIYNILCVFIWVFFLKWWYPQNTPKWSFLVGKPMVVGYHHFRKHPYVYKLLKDFFPTVIIVDAKNIDQLPASLWIIHCNPTRWAPTSCKWSYCIESMYLEKNLSFLKSKQPASTGTKHPNENLHQSFTP